jgi:FKBP-type peptidyl-prolyl cis-trans isomerase FklB
MKKLILSTVLIAISFACNKTTSNESVKSDDVSKKSYSVGYDLGQQIPRAIGSLDKMDIDQFVLGMKDALKKTPQLTEEEIKTMVEQYRAAAMAERAKEFSSVGKTNMDEGKAFLAENKTKPGVKETASGLQYKVVKAGSAKKPKATDKVEVHYEGTLINGTIFDSSYKRGQTIEFGLNQVIKGWTEGVQLIGEGGEIMLYIPSELAYGSNGSGKDIGPNATIIFKVELIKIK